jgi:PTS system cellobiose-specific IIB component
VVVLLPSDIFGDLDGTRTLGLVQDALSVPADSVPAHRNDTAARQEKD